MADQKAGASRRDLLKFGAASVPAAVATLATGATPAAAETETGATSGLRKTEHVKKYLDSARF